MRTAEQRETTLRLITLYKLVKSSAGLTFAAVLWILVLEGKTDLVAGMAEHVRHHLTAAWANKLVSLFVDAADRHHIEVAAAALTLDGASNLLEWYALSTGKAWGEWLVVLATSSLIPFELVSISRHHSPGRIAILVVNVGIVAYLGRHAWKKHLAARGGESERPTPRASEAHAKDVA